MSTLIETYGTTAEIVVGTVILALLSKQILRLITTRVVRKTKTELDDLLVKCLESPVVSLVIVLGVYAAVISLLHSHGLDLSDKSLSKYADKANHYALAAMTLIVSWIVLRMFNTSSWWYARTVATTGKSQIDVLRKVINIAGWAIVAVLVLGQLGYKVTMLMTSLGVAGLAVALALQDTLSNLFSGVYLMADKSVKVGDYIKLDTGQEGFVEDVSWRHTRVRLWENNTVIIPNAKLIQSVITNCELPAHEMSVYVSCGVSYDSDLDEVERVTVDVAKEVLERVPGSVSNFEPVVRFKEFGDSNIDFIVVLRAKDVSSQYLLRHEFVKALHRRYRETGIDISYPVRTLISHDGRAVPRLPGDEAEQS